MDSDLLSHPFAATISELSVEALEGALASSGEHGADLRFLGVVRDSEDGAPIAGIRYTHYEGMALSELERIGEAMRVAYPEHLARIHHRVGFVAAGEASLWIRVLTRHSAAGFEILPEYLRRIKESVPIWKEIVPIAP